MFEVVPAKVVSSASLWSCDYESPRASLLWAQTSPAEPLIDHGLRSGIDINVTQIRMVFEHLKFSTGKLKKKRALLERLYTCLFTEHEALEMLALYDARESQTKDCFCSTFII